MLFSTVDVNECERGNMCGEAAKCENTVGSYKCSCPSKGFQYNAERGRCLGKKCLVGPFL